MKFFSITPLILFLTLAGVGWGQEGKNANLSPKGAVIVVALKQPVLFFQASGIPSSKKIEIGSILFEGKSAMVGKGGSLTLLLSNGTLVTMESETKMKIGLFEQEPFNSANLKVSDLEGEPSNSKVEIDLEFGALVVKTKKLKSNSSFAINSEAGTAGVRGTEFQLSQAPGSGIQLDVTESTVAFTPPGGQPVPVSQGQGLDVSASGVVSSRPVNPVVAQNVSAKNESATQASGEVSLGSVSDAMTEATTTASEPAGESSPFDSSSETLDISESEFSDPTPAEPAVEEPMSDEPAPAEESSDDSSESSESGESSQTGEASSESSSSESDSGDSSPPTESESTASSEPAQESSSSASSSTDLELPAAETATGMVDDVLEQNPDAKETRQSGKTSTFASRLAELSLDAGQMEKFYTLSESSQNSILNLETDIILRLLSIQDFGMTQADVLFSYAPDTRSLLFQLENIPLLAVLDQAIDESLLLASIDDAGISASQSSELPEELTLTEVQQKVLLLGNELRATGNLEIFEEIQKLSDGVWTDDWIQVAQVGNQLSQDYDFRKDLATLQALEGTEALANPFFVEVSTLYDTLLLDQIDGGTNPAVVGGSTLTFGAESYDLSPLLGDKSSLLLGASDSLILGGQIIFNSVSGTDPRILAVSGGTIQVGVDTSIQSVVGDLVLSARQDILLQNTSLESAREVAIRSLRDLQLNEVTIQASSLVHLKASGYLDVDGLQLSQSLPSLIMEATTIRLSNVDFPSATSVQLNSLKGPIDGSYPNFGTSIPVSEQLGRVNFLQNVSSGGNPLTDRSSFDQFGSNISIGKTNP
tara:strand:- start:2287 stop:4749 length:2463 start_codon:yes stop_codon:yes gene_type:complete